MPNKIGRHNNIIFLKESLKILLFSLILLFGLIPTADALRNDSIDVWHKWEKEDLEIVLIENKYATEERILSIYDVVFNQKTYQIDDNLMHKGPVGDTSTYYLGWQHALASITNTTDPVPANIKMKLLDQPKGDIIILLNNYKHPQNYSAFTSLHSGKIIIDIYEIESLGLGQLKTITRHELGHAFGISHSTAPEDMMYPAITTPYPYISQCNLRAVESIYNGNFDGVTCLK